MDQLTYFWLLIRASLFSTGGSGNFPILYQDFLSRGWATDRQFAEALAIGQVTPGPTGLWVISLGYLTNGLLGALMAVVAITVPPLLVLGVNRLYRRIGHHAAVQGFMRGLSLAVIGVFLVVLTRLLRGTGIEARSITIGLVSLAVGLTGRVPVMVVIGVAAFVGILLY